MLNICEMNVTERGYNFRDSDVFPAAARWFWALRVIDTMGVVHLFGLLLVLTNSSKYSTDIKKHFQIVGLDRSEILGKINIIVSEAGSGIASSAIPFQSLAERDSRSEFGHKSNSNHRLSKHKI